GKQDKVTTVLALDVSGSMLAPADDVDKTSKIDALKKAALNFLNFIRETDPPIIRTTVLKFGDEPAAPAMFTNNKPNLKNLINNLKAGGETSLFDATYEAIAALEAERPRGKKAVVAMTDGVDNKSRRRVEEIIDRAKEAKVPLYLIGFGRTGEGGKASEL